MALILEETAEAISSFLGAKLNDIAISRAVFGLFFSGVKLSTGHGGLCYTPVKDLPEAVCCPSQVRAMPLSGQLSGRPAASYLDDVFGTNVLKKTLGIAVLNALSELCLEDPACQEKHALQYETLYHADAFDVMEFPKGSKVVVIGALAPMLKRLLRDGHDFTVLELDPRTLKGAELEHFLPVSKTDTIVPGADALVITGTTLLNNTLDHILSLKRPGAQALVTGPTASMLPGAFFAHGVTMLGGIRVTNPDDALDIISEAGSGYHLFGRSAERTVIDRRQIT